MLKYKYIFKIKYAQKQFYQRALGTVMVRNCRSADCSLKNEFIALVILIFGTLSLPVCVPRLTCSLYSQSYSLGDSSDVSSGYQSIVAT